MVAKTGAERSKEYREKNEQGRKLIKLKYSVKTSKKCISDPAFDMEFKRKEADRKRKYQARKASEAESERNEVEVALDTTEEDTENSFVQEPKRSRQAFLGFLQRKKNNKAKNDSIGSLMVEKRELEKEIHKLGDSILEAHTESEELSVALKRSEAEVAKLKALLKENDVWLQNTFKYCTAETKKNFTTAYQIAFSANEIPKGTTLRLLRNAGVNFSKKLREAGNDKSELKKAIEKFAQENSSEIPDMRQQKKGIRYMKHYLTTLYEDFKFCNPEMEVSYSTFTSYWPKNVIKPRPGDYAKCVCEKCENPSLKLHALKTHKLIPQEVDIDTVLRDLKMDDFASEEDLKSAIESLLVEPKSSVQVKFLQWEKVESKEINQNTGRRNQATTQRVPKYQSAKDLAMDFLSDFKLLKEHLARNDVIKASIKAKREEVLDSDDKVMLHFDWAENGQIILPNEVQAAYYGVE